MKKPMAKAKAPVKKPAAKAVAKKPVKKYASAGEVTGKGMGNPADKLESLKQSIRETLFGDERKPSLAMRDSRIRVGVDKAGDALLKSHIKEGVDKAADDLMKSVKSAPAKAPAKSAPAKAAPAKAAKPAPAKPSRPAPITATSPKTGETFTPNPRSRSTVTGKVQTKGGEYKTYKKNSAMAQSFRSKFAAAKEGEIFDWNGKKYVKKTK